MQKGIGLTGFGIGVFGLALFLAGIGNPSSYVYDESMYVIGARSLLRGSEDMNPQHPPLAKFLIAGSIKVFEDTPFAWRLPGAILGALTLVAIFFWTHLFLRDYTLSLLAAFLTLFNNFLFVMSRVAMLDVFYFAFVMWGVLAFSAAILLDTSLARRRVLVGASGVLFGLGAACKWNAIVSLAVVALVAAVLYIRDSHRLREIGAPALGLALAVLPVAVYLAAYWPLCYRFHRPFTSAEVIAMNQFIWRYHVECPGNPALDVHWYEWFFRASPERGLSYLMGNFVVAWGGLLALAICAWKFCRSWLLAEGLVVLLYAANLLQWVVIPQKRLVYYYYYPPAMFLGVAIAIVLSRADSPRLFGVRLSTAILLAAAVFFAYCYPRMAGLQSPYDCMFGCWI